MVLSSLAWRRAKDFRNCTAPPDATVELRLAVACLPFSMNWMAAAVSTRPVFSCISTSRSTAMGFTLPVGQVADGTQTTVSPISGAVALSSCEAYSGTRTVHVQRRTVGQSLMTSTGMNLEWCHPFDYASLTRLQDTMQLHADCCWLIFQGLCTTPSTLLQATNPTSCSSPLVLLVSYPCQGWHSRRGHP